MNDQDEMFEAATETPVSLGCPQHMPKQLPTQRKHTMDFGRFHVTRAAIPGRCVITFRRKQEVLAEFGSVVPGRIIIADIFTDDSGHCQYKVVVKSYMPGEDMRILFTVDSDVSRSNTEKMIYKMVKCHLKNTQRRHEVRKRHAAAAKRAAAKKEVK